MHDIDLMIHAIVMELALEYMYYGCIYINCNWINLWLEYAVSTFDTGPDTTLKCMGGSKMISCTIVYNNVILLIMVEILPFLGGMGDNTWVNSVGMTGYGVKRDILLSIVML